MTRRWHGAPCKGHAARRWREGVPDRLAASVRARVTRAQSGQPSWRAALVTTPPYLVEQIRYDRYIEHVGNDAGVRNIGVNKGLRPVPTGTAEIDIAPPNHIERSNKNPATGFVAAAYRATPAILPVCSRDWIASLRMAF